jgi:hypothetical protein
MGQALEELTRRYPLPHGWSPPDPFNETVVIARSSISLSGFSTSSPQGEQVTGSAGGEASLTRGYFELLERVSIFSALRSSHADFPLRDRSGREIGAATRAQVFPESPRPDRWRHSLSNGVALHVSWAEACDRALAELVERDRVLRSWYGESTPHPFALAPDLVPEGLRELATWSAYEIPFDRGIEAPLSVAAVVGLPRDEATPLTYGFAARATAREAMEAALREALQRFGFLFGEEIPGAIPALTPSADFHQEFYLYPPSRPLFQRWLDGAGSPAAPEDRSLARGTEVYFVDLTPKHLRGNVFVAKALCDAAEPLVFGEPAPHREHAAPERRVHPIA